MRGRLILYFDLEGRSLLGKSLIEMELNRASMAVLFMFACLFQGDVATTACMSSCKHLATKLKSYLVNDEVGVALLVIILPGE